MKRVLKYSVDMKLPGYVEMNMPDWCHLIHQDTQHENCCWWFELDDEAEGHLVRRKLHIVWTGNSFDENLIHRGTFLVDGGALVLHIYEER